jgi:hypothetical protein
MMNTLSASAPLRRRLTSALLMLGLTLGTLAMTAKPVDAASVVWACHTQDGTNFLIDRVVVKLMAWRATGAHVEVARQVFDAKGCAYFVVPTQNQGDYLFTLTNLMDTRSFYGSYYNGNSYYSQVFIANYGWYTQPSYGGYAHPGPHVWYLQGSTSCLTCRWV